MTLLRHLRGSRDAQGATDSPPKAIAEPGSRRADLRMLAFEISLGAVAGGLAGLLVGGIGGRIAMFILRVTSGDSVNGVTSDDGFVIGRFSIDTLNLLAAGAGFGSIVGLLMVGGRPFLPHRGMPFAWGVSGALCGGALFINTDGVDFTLLSPLWLAVAMFIALPAVGALLAAYFVEWFRPWWWENRRLTFGLAPAAIPAIIFVPIGVVTLVIAGLWFGVLRVARLRTFHQWRATRVLAILVFIGVSGLFAEELTRKVREVL